MFLVNLANRLMEDKRGEVDEKAVLMVVLVLGTLAGVGLVAGAVNGLLGDAAAGL
jgi:hypothetical protein